MENIPDKEWYDNISQSRDTDAHCPFATVEACPRYYQSLSLLSVSGSTKIPKDEDERLLEMWKKSDLWPRTDEQATSVSGSSMFSNYCPEVSYERFGYFVTFLARYADEIDRDVVHQRLIRDKTPGHHPGWQWASWSEQHFSDCPLYSIIKYRQSDKAEENKSAQPWWQEHLVEITIGIIVAFFGVIIAKVIG